MEAPGLRSTLLITFGVVIVLGILAKALLRRIDVPAVVGYLVIGVGLAAADRAVLHLPEQATEALELLADLGIVCLLFRVGLESDLRVLWSQLPRALVALVGNVSISFALALVAASACGLALVPSLFVAVALSATSIAIAAFVWEGAGLLRSRVGSLVIDVAELDDLAAVLLLVLLLAAVPPLRGDGDLGATVGPALLGVLTRFVLFASACWLFARHVERRLTASFRRFRHGPDPMLSMVGVAIVIAAVAGWMGFSLAVGALFAGLAFSRDPRAVRLEASFEPVHDLLAPFFFVAVGANLDLSALVDSLGLGLVLLVAAIVGKVGGSMLPLWPSVGLRAALVVGVSMVPRAEIALFVVDQGRRAGPEMVPAEVHGAVVLVVAVTCLLTPPLLRRMLTAHREEIERSGAAPGDAS